MKGDQEDICSPCCADNEGTSLQIRMILLSLCRLYSGILLEKISRHVELLINTFWAIFFLSNMQSSVSVQVDGPNPERLPMID